jgi:hypothetical protein
MLALFESAFARRWFSVLSSSFAATALGLSLILGGQPSSAYGQTEPDSTKVKSTLLQSAGGSALPPHQAAHADTGVQSSTDAAARTASKGVNQGILVSGYWKIDVRNPDGSLAKHVEFENALTSDAINYWLPWALLGQGPQPGIAGHIAGVDQPAVGINTPSPIPFYGYNMPNFNAGPCGGFGCLLAVKGSAADNNCQNVYGIGSSYCLETLAVFQQQQSAVTVLQGSFVSSGGTITDVETYITFCADSASCDVPSGSTVGSNFIHANVDDFTSYTLPTPVQVAAGQSVNISVTISFGSGSAASASTAAVPVHRATPLVANPASAVSKP